MDISTKNRRGVGANRTGLVARCGGRISVLVPAMLTLAMMLTACGGGGSSSVSQIPLTLVGNWQFTMAPPADGSFLGGLQGGFLQQASGSVTGAVAYAVSLPGLLIPCSTGSASISGTISGQTVNLTAVAGTQTFTLTGTLSLDSSTIVGTYTSTAGTSGDGAPCGTLQVTPMQWSAILVPPISGTIQGNFHSTGGAAGLTNQDFLVSGSVTQGSNSGASSATVTGTLNFSNSDYPCFASDSVSIYGQISGNLVSLQLVGSDDSILGQIGAPTGSNGVTGINPVTFDSAQGGYILHGTGPSYLVATSACPGNIDSIASAGDYGNLCLAVQGASGSTNACQQPIALTPVALVFPEQATGTSSYQTITLSNTSTGTLSGLALTFVNIPANALDFSETDVCGLGGLPSLGQPFSLTAGQSCAITITFSPECESQCTGSLNATLTVTSPTSTDTDDTFLVPVSGTAESGSSVRARANHSGKAEELGPFHLSGH